MNDADESNYDIEQSLNVSDNEEIFDSDDDFMSDTELDDVDWFTENSDYDDDKDDNNKADSEKEVQQLREWAIKKQICQSHLDDLLKILRARLLPTLPKTAKTFLKTINSKYSIVQMEDSNGGFGEYTYFGMENELKEIVNPELHETNTIELTINVDPVPLTKSGTKQFTPILCKIHHNPDVYKVFPIAIFLGNGKPISPEIFLEEFVHEMNNLQTHGIEISDKHFEIKLKCIICDTPARSFLKKTLGHGGLYACERCTVKGERVENRTVYPDVDCEERTDYSFRNKLQPEHHHSGESPILNIFPRINIISCFVLDFMHLICIGIMKKMLEFWTKGKLNYRLGRRFRIELERRMESLKSQVPCEFQRKPRSTSSIAKWKATELRFFVLYCGPIVMKGLLNDDLYRHFLLLFSACRILCSEALCLLYNAEAKRYLRSFFIALKDFYGPQSQTLNTHHLIHLADDVKFMECNLNRFTAFPFESYLGKMKKFLRTANRPLAQMCRRLYEAKFSGEKKKPSLPPLVEIVVSKKNEPTKIKYKNVTITNTNPDNMVILNDDTIVQIDNILKDLTFEGRIWKKKKPIFTYPSNSKHFKMWQLENAVSSKEIKKDINDINGKLVKLSLSFKENAPEKLFVIPLIHC